MIPENRTRFNRYLRNLLFHTLYIRVVLYYNEQIHVTPGVLVTPSNASEDFDRNQIVPKGILE